MADKLIVPHCITSQSGGPQDFIDHYFYQWVEHSWKTQIFIFSQKGRRRRKRKKSDSPTDTHDLMTNSIQISVLQSINKQLEVFSMLHQEMNDLRVSLEFTYLQIINLQPADGQH